MFINIIDDFRIVIHFVSNSLWFCKRKISKGFFSIYSI